MIHSASDYQKAREVGSKYAEFQILAGAMAKRDRWVSPSTTFLYRCPIIGFRVQGFVADNAAEKNGYAYEALTCLVCKRIHLVDPKTGTVAGSDDK